MRGFVSYVLAGIFIGLALNMVAPPVGLGVSFGASPNVDPTVQTVDRSHKGDRTPVSTTVGKQLRPQHSPIVLTGCDPAFSPLSASAQANFAGRCVA